MQLSVSPDLKSNPKKLFSFVKNNSNENIGVSKKEITMLLKKLPPSKASGTDMISAILLKETDQVAIELIMLF